MRSDGRLVLFQGLVVGLEAGHDAQVGLTIGTVVLGLPAQNPSVGVGGVPAVVAPQGRALPGLGTVPELFHR